MAPLHLLQALHQARDRDGATARARGVALDRAIGSEVHVARRGAGGDLARVDREALAVGEAPHDEAPAPDPRAELMGHAAREGGRHRRVDRIPAQGQDLGPSLGGRRDRGRDHAALGKDRGRGSGPCRGRSQQQRQQHCAEAHDSGHGADGTTRFGAHANFAGHAPQPLPRSPPGPRVGPALRGL